MKDTAREKSCKADNEIAIEQYKIISFKAFKYIPAKEKDQEWKKNSAE